MRERLDGVNLSAGIFRPGIRDACLLDFSCG